MTNEMSLLFGGIIFSVLVIILLFNNLLKFSKSRKLKSISEKQELINQTEKLLIEKEYFKDQSKKLNDQLIDIEYKFSYLKKEKEDEILKLKRIISNKDSFYSEFINFNDSIIQKIPSIVADFQFIQFDLSIDYLKSKKHPALTEAKRISELKNEAKNHFEKFKIMQYKYEFLLNLFPELTDYVEDFHSIKDLADFNSINSLEEDFDRVQFFLSKTEFLDLSINERNQLALDRYINGKKNKWQIGRDFEQYCGYHYEKQGWQVNYFGIENGVQDLGRDLIAIKENQHLVVQCKYWSKEKTIREKHIAQLFGTTVMYKLKLPKNITVKPVFITNIILSSEAKEFANYLGVEVIESFKLQSFPRIKCNIGVDEYGQASKIYHLPFDQQYDKTKINKKGKFFAFSVDEAVKAGFRRAFRYFN